MEDSPKVTISSEVDPEHPFPGLLSFEERNQSQFGGRDVEISELFTQIEANSLTIIFGKSGIGKTSLIKAGLIPILQKNLYHPVYIRIDFSSDKAPLQQLKELLVNQLRVVDKNVPEIQNKTLWAYLHEVNLLYGMFIPVIIFDQFEEIFTLGSKKGSASLEDFITELSNLAENWVPLVVQEAKELKSETILSNYVKQPYRLIISLREDYLAQLESLKNYLPSIRNSRYRLLQMTVEQALDAIIRPAKGLIDENVAVEIIQKLPGISPKDLNTFQETGKVEKKYLIEPFLLSLICFQLNEKRISEHLKTITSTLVTQFDIEDVISSYYSDTIAEFGPHIQNGIEHTLLTESGYRKLEPLDDLLLKYKISIGEINKLIDKRIIRKEFRDGVEYVELIHDVLTPVVRQKREERIKSESENEKKQAISSAINIYKEKRRRNIRTFLLIVVPVLMVVGYMVIKENNENSRTFKRYQDLDFARKLLITSRIARNKGDSDVAAHLSRIAFLINREHKGGNDFDYYKSMYERLSDLDSSFVFTDVYPTAVRSIVRASNDLFFFACESGEIFNKSWIGEKQPFFDFKKRITDMAISPDKRYLAVAGIFDYVCVFDLTKSRKDTIQLSKGRLGINGKSVAFTDDGKLILKLDSTLLSWTSISWQPTIWKNRIKVEKTANTTKVFAESQTKNLFEYKGSQFNCFAVQHNEIAIGVDSGFILIKKDSVIRIKLPDFYRPVSIRFDPSGKYIITGNNEGNLCSIELSNFQMVCNQYQISRITDITFSSEGKYITTASWDGSIAIWDNKFRLDSVVPLILPPSEENQNANCTIFSQDMNYILSAYGNGKIIKWGVNMDILAKSICEKTKIKLDAALWRKYTGKRISFNEIEKYSCSNYHQ